jgi:uncharacterized protein YkwD
MRTIILCILLISLNLKATSQVLNTEEQELYRIMMNYRSQHGLPSIPFSKSLTIVAQTHVRDLYKNTPDKGICNMHSWSSNGPWTGCCYTPDHAQANCMWSKPRELTSYKGNGFEIACSTRTSDNSDYNITANEALESWKGSPGHNQVIINGDIWTDKWNAIGIGMYKGYAVVWFGNELDDEK